MICYFSLLFQIKGESVRVCLGAKLIRAKDRESRVYGDVHRTWDDTVHVYPRYETVACTTERSWTQHVRVT